MPKHRGARRLPRANAAALVPVGGADTTKRHQLGPRRPEVDLPLIGLKFHRNVTGCVHIQGHIHVRHATPYRASRQCNDQGCSSQLEGRDKSTPRRIPANCAGRFRFRLGAVAGFRFCLKAASRVNHFSVVPAHRPYSRSYVSVTAARARSIVLLAGLAVAALGSIGAAAASGQGEPGAPCSLRDCKSMLRLHFGEYTDAHKSIKRVRLCAQGRCHSARGDALATRHVQIALRADDAEPIRITVLAYDSRGRLRLKRSLRLSVEGVNANGPECGPVCYYGTARLTARGRLLDAGPGLT